MQGSVNEDILSLNDSDWKLLFSNFMIKLNLNIFFLGQFDLTEFPPKLPDFFYKEATCMHGNRVIHAEKLYIRDIKMNIYGVRKA